MFKFMDYSYCVLISSGHQDISCKVLSFGKYFKCHLNHLLFNKSAEYTKYGIHLHSIYFYSGSSNRRSLEQNGAQGVRPSAST